MVTMTDKGKPGTVNARWHNLIEEGLAVPLRALGFTGGEANWGLERDGLVWKADAQRNKYDTTTSKSFAVNIRILVPGFGAFIDPAEETAEDTVLVGRLGRLVSGHDLWIPVQAPGWWRLNKAAAAATADSQWTAWMREGIERRVRPLVTRLRNRKELLDCLLEDGTEVLRWDLANPSMHHRRVAVLAAMLGRVDILARFLALLELDQAGLPALSQPLHADLCARLRTLLTSGSVDPRQRP